MRKKSHICLAKYIVENVRQTELLEHRFDFYLGSILPDCKPSFLTTKHEISGTFEKVAEEIRRLSEFEDGKAFPNKEQNMRAYFRDLGQIIHYIADYFTFPHNVHYDGTLKDHCIYEEHLKKNLREYIRDGEAVRVQGTVRTFHTAEEICEFIKYSHECYMKIKTDVYEDCKHIVSLCCMVVEGVLQFLRLHFNHFVLKTV